MLHPSSQSTEVEETAAANAQGATVSPGVGRALLGAPAAASSSQAPSAPIPTALSDRLAAALGLCPLVLYALAHLVEVGSALGGRNAWNARFEVTATRPWLVAKLVLVGVPLVLHAALSLRRSMAALAVARRSAPPERGTGSGSPRGDGSSAGFPSQGLRRLQMLTGLVLGAWLVTHVAALTARLWGGAEAAWLYEALRIDAGRPVAIVGASLGVAALGTHVALGLPAAAHTLGFVTRPPTRGRARLLGGALGLLLWAGYVDVWMLFASGAAPVGDRRVPLGAEEVAPVAHSAASDPATASPAAVSRSSPVPVSRVPAAAASDPATPSPAAVSPSSPVPLPSAPASSASP